MHPNILFTVGPGLPLLTNWCYVPRGLLASAGLDREVLIWDMEVGRAHTGMPFGSDLRDAVPARADGHQDSVYCLATNAAGSVVVSGSTERVSRHAIGLLRMWDPRTAAKAGRLKGHTDNVRCVMVSQDGSKCISGSSDATVKLWDLGQQRCIQTFNMHSDSVWTLATDVSFTRLFSGGRDKLVYCTDLRTFDSTCLIGTSDPILKLVVSTNNGLWVSMAKSDLEYWDVKDVVERHASPSNTRRPIRKSLSAQVDDESDLDPVPKLHKPHARIEGLPSIIKHGFLDNRRQVLVEDTVGAVSILDVTTGNQVKTFGRVNFERARQELEQKIAVPAWCSVDCKLGSVCVNLDFPQVFSCEVYAPDAGFPSGPDFDEQKLNVGLRICRTLFRQWRLKRNQHEPANARQRQLDDDEQDVELDERFDFDLPPDTRVIVSEGGGGCCVATKTLSQWDGREETLLPEWMVESIQRGYPSNEHGQPLADAPKIGFHLVRYPSSQDIKAMQPGKLNAPQILRARKVLSYAVSKLSLQLADVPSYMRRTGLDQPADYLELLCDDNLVPTGVCLHHLPLSALCNSAPITV